MTNLIPNDNPLPDMEAFKKGDQNEFRKIFEMYHKGMLGFACKILENQEEAKDIVIQAFTKLWEKREDFEHLYQVKDYLLKTIRGNCRGALKSKSKLTAKQKEFIHLSEEEQEAFTERESINASLQAQLAEVVSQLPDQCRKVFELKIYEEKSYDDIIKIMGISRDNAYKLYSDALKKINLLIKPK